MRTLLATTATIALLGVVSTGAQAAPVTFFGEDLNPGGTTPIAHPISDATQAAFFATLNSPGTETFESFNNGDTNISPNFANGVTATLSGGSVQNFSSFGRFAISGTNYYNTQTSSFVINFNTPIAAFGFYGTDIGDFGGELSLTLVDNLGNVSSVDVPAEQGSDGLAPEDGSVLYFGFYDLSDTYTSISFNNSNTADAFGFDDFTVGVAQQVTVPEPASLALIGGGLAALAALRRRSKTKN